MGELACQEKSFDKIGEFKCKNQEIETGIKKELRLYIGTPFVCVMHNRSSKECWQILFFHRWK